MARPTNDAVRQREDDALLERIENYERDAIRRCLATLDEARATPAVLHQVEQRLDALVASFRTRSRPPEGPLEDREDLRAVLRRLCTAGLGPDRDEEGRELPLAELTQKWRAEADAAETELARMRGAVAEASALRERLEGAELRPLRVPPADRPAPSGPESPPPAVVDPPPIDPAVMHMARRFHEGGGAP